MVSIKRMSTSKDRTKGLNLHFIGEKTKHVPYSEIDKIEIYSHANKFGNGADSVSVGFARKQIKEFQNNIANVIS